MNWKRVTQGFVVAVVLVVGVYDLVALYFGGPGATISRFALSWPPALVFALGFCFGHMVWPQRAAVTN